jgi:hypothetical protein
MITLSVLYALHRTLEHTFKTIKPVSVLISLHFISQNRNTHLINSGLTSQLLLFFQLPPQNSLSAPGSTWTLLNSCDLSLIIYRYWPVENTSQSQSYLTTTGYSVSLSWYQATIRGQRPILLSLPRKIFADICGFFLVGRPLLKRGYVCNLSVQLLLGHASAMTPRSKNRRTRDHILLSPLTTRRAMVRQLNPTSTRVWLTAKSKSTQQRLLPYNVSALTAENTFENSYSTARHRTRIIHLFSVAVYTPMPSKGRCLHSSHLITTIV